MPKLTIGADPEIFLKSGRKNISAHGLIPGNKEKPHKLEGGACQLDGTAVEFNINPCHTAIGFADSVTHVLNQIRKMIPKKYSFDIRPAVFYGPKYFEGLPDDVKELGCNPDHDAYNKGERNQVPENNGTMRTGAGHIHFGFCKDAKVDDPSHMLDCIMLVKNMDLLVSSVEHLWDNDVDRRLMYGKLGCFRPKTYGVEYRSLSNAWVAHPELYQFIFKLSQYAFAVTVEGKNLSEYGIFGEKFGFRTWNHVMPKIPSIRYGHNFLQPPLFPVNFKPVPENKHGPRIRKSRGRAQAA